MRSGKTMKSMALLAGFMTFAGMAPLPAQVIDTTGAPDTTRKPAVQSDTTKSAKPGKTTDSTAARSEPKAAPASLTALGKVDGPVRLSADLSERQLTVVAGNGAIRTFNVAIGTKAYPTPTGTFRIRKIVWNPSWVPPDSKWAKGKTAKGPGEPGNPMKVAKIFFKEPDFYIHGTAQVNSLGTADSHGCLRMSPDEVAELAQFLMQNGGQAREEGWFSRIIHLRWKTTTVTLSNPVLLTISH
jgi:lipoprotein-anchoring transpeptidase ErfK/SrfK